jgi:peptidyl-prolyl cis-trans isomerase SurA
MRKVMLLVAVFVFVAGAAWAGEIVNRVAAVIDDEVITLYQVEQAAAPLIEQMIQENPTMPEADRAKLAAKIKAEVLRGLIEQKLLENEINRLGIEVTDAEIDAYIERIKQANNYSDEVLEAALARQGLTRQEFRERIKTEILREQYVTFRLRDRLVVRDEDVRAYYNNHRDEFAGEPVMHLSELRINLPPEATDEQVQAAFKKINEIYQQLLAGGDFAELARQNSQGATADNGGDIGEFKPEELKEVYRKAAAVLEAGQTSTIYRDEYGFFIIKMLEKKLGGQQPFEEVEERIRMVLRKQRADLEMTRLAGELYRRSYVEILIHFTDNDENVEPAEDLPQNPQPRPPAAEAPEPEPPAGPPAPDQALPPPQPEDQPAQPPDEPAPQAE